jgi:hypothetical protein
MLGPMLMADPSTAEVPAAAVSCRIPAGAYLYWTPLLDSWSPGQLGAE